jgi:hypothetical protein
VPQFAMPSGVVVSFKRVAPEALQRPIASKVGRTTQRRNAESLRASFGSHRYVRDRGE